MNVHGPGGRTTTPPASQLVANRAPHASFAFGSLDLVSPSEVAMTRSRPSRSARWCPSGALPPSASSTPLFAQRSDRATISGVVSDPQGSPCRAPLSPSRTKRRAWRRPHHQRGGRVHEPSARPGPLHGVGRSQRVQEVAVTSGIRAAGRRRAPPRRDAAGRRADRIGRGRRRVPGSSETRPDVSHTVNEKYYRDLPIVTRLPTCAWPRPCCRCNPATCR